MWYHRYLGFVAYYSVLVTSAFITSVIVGFFFCAACVALLRLRPPDRATYVLLLNGLIAHLLSVGATSYTHGYLGVTHNPGTDVGCKVGRFFDELGTYALSFHFLYLILIRLFGEAVSQRTGRTPVAAAGYAAALSWLVGIFVAIPAASPAVALRRHSTVPMQCVTPLSYSAMDMTLKVCFATALPMLVLLALVVEAASRSSDARFWSLVKRIVAFYVYSALVHAPYLTVRVVRAILIPDDFPSVLDYVESFGQTLCLSRLGAWPLFLFLFASSRPISAGNEIIDRLLEILSERYEWWRQWRRSAADRERTERERARSRSLENWSRLLAKLRAACRNQRPVSVSVNVGEAAWPAVGGEMPCHAMSTLGEDGGGRPAAARGERSEEAGEGAGVAHAEEEGEASTPASRPAEEGEAPAPRPAGDEDAASPATRSVAVGTGEAGEPELRVSSGTASAGGVAVCLESSC
ncbi:T78 [Tupaiid betaherpesvirus 1]|uniref:T78 n=1 Tax=Tupaiid herpesvirus 1 (strain 1) TaxID=10397 RepID=Q91TL8_TUHV1|nr:T78 [Tupaiid betaherpesvirus 1]AAK57123.1 T78 [Tupaiid betaherpesvirus 1]